MVNTSLFATGYKALGSLHVGGDVSAQPEFAVGWGTLALINAGLAQDRNRSGMNWFLLSLILGPIATFVLVVIYKKITRTVGPRSQRNRRRQPGQNHRGRGSPNPSRRWRQGFQIVTQDGPVLFRGTYKSYLEHQAEIRRRADEWRNRRARRDSVKMYSGGREIRNTSNCETTSSNGVS